MPSPLLDEIEKLAALAVESGAREITVQSGERRITVSLPRRRSREELVESTPESTGTPSPETPESPAPEEAEVLYVTSPIVGILHHADPPLSAGAFVQSGQILCEIESMKLMNEVRAPSSGEIIAVLTDDGQAVEYGQRLFDLRPLTPPGD